MTAETITTFGEAMIRLAPPNHKRLEQCETLDLEVGGAELNTAVGVARLGRSVSWVTRLTDNPMGRVIANRARQAGVETADILWTDQDRVGIYYVEFGAAPRPTNVMYDRAGSAMAQLRSGAIEWQRIFSSSRWFYVTGITPALSSSAAAATLEALQLAKASGATTFLDPNYRAKLWSVEQAAVWLNRAIPYVDVLITNPEDLSRFFQVSVADVEQAAAEAAVKLQLQAIAVTLRHVHSVWRNGCTAIGFRNGKIFRTATYEVEIVDRLGAGDAFVAGLMHGMLDDDFQKGLDFGVAMSALKHTIPGDLPRVTQAEVEDLLQGGGLRIRR